MFYYYLREHPYITIMTVSIDQWCAGIGYFMEKSIYQLKYLTQIFVYQNLFSLVYCFYLFLFCFYCVTEMLNPIQDQRKIKNFLFGVVTGM